MQHNTDDVCQEANHHKHPHDALQREGRGGEGRGGTESLSNWFQHFTVYVYTCAWRYLASKMYKKRNWVCKIDSLHQIAI